MTSPTSEFPERLWLGGAIGDSLVELVLYAADIDLGAVTAALGCSPSSALTRGQQVGRRPPAPIGHWSLEAPRDLRFEEKVAFLLSATTPDPQVWQRLSQAHSVQLRCAAFLGSWSEGFALPAAVIAELGARGWSFSLAMYSAEGEEILDAFLSGEPVPPARPSQ